MSAQKYYADHRTALRELDGSIVYTTPMPFCSIAKVANCLCEDGKRRTVYVTSEPDTFFSIPATCKIRGKNVSGYLTTDDCGYESLTGYVEGRGWRFHAYTYGKNAGVLEQSRQPKRKPILRLNTRKLLATAKDNARFDERGGTNRKYRADTIRMRLQGKTGKRRAFIRSLHFARYGWKNS